MNIAEYSVTKKVTTWLFIILFLAGGFTALQDISRLEDPEFTIKEGKVYTTYPGATPLEVEREVTYHIENAVQQLQQLKRVESISQDGFSEVTVVIKDKYKKSDFPNIWDELRRKINDVQSELPPGSNTSVVLDDFGDVFGLFYALSGDGYSYRELKDYADILKEQLLLVPGVRKITIDGEQKEVAYLEISRSNMAKLGISNEQFRSVLKSQNLVSNSGNVRVGDEYIRINPTGQLKSVQEIGELLISGSNNTLVRLKDIASVRRTYEEVPKKYTYFNGKPALNIGISMLSGENVVTVGNRLDQRLAELQTVTPIGMQLDAIYNQPGIVDVSVTGFVLNVVLALVIVIVVLLFFMGLRTGFIIGAILLITVSGTVWFMNAYAIDLQRISLGALIIALGMLVDNAIVVAEGMLVRIKRGEDGIKAAREVVSATMWPLLGGTIVGILAFAAIGLSQDATGEFANSLFWVIFISLLLSWFTAVTMTPLLCVQFLKADKPGEGRTDPYAGFIFQKYRSLLSTAIRVRWFTLSVVIILFASAIYGFGYVKQSFFPDSNTPMFFFDLWNVEGTDIRKTRDDLLKIDDYLRTLDGVVSTASYVGSGATRFTLVYSPESPSSAYGQIIVTAESLDDMQRLQKQVLDYAAINFPDSEPKTKPLRIGPGRDAKIEARINGPDPVVLRQLSEQVQQIMADDGSAINIKDDWRQPVKVIRPIYNEKAARQLGVTRENVSNAMLTAFDGQQVGLFKDGIRLLPIIMLPPAIERSDVSAIRDIPVYSPVLRDQIPIGQAVSDFKVEWADAKIKKRNRIYTITPSCDPAQGLATPLFERVKPLIEGMKLPPGYILEWGGEYEDSRDANAAIGSTLPAGFLAMIVVVILLFGKVRQPLIIWLTVPLAVIGITAGLLLMNVAFGFMGLLGALSLVGLLIKNAIVLIDEIDQQIDSGKEGYNAILDSAVSRMRPVMMAASTTILGMAPLLSDVFFLDMAVVIMFGLGFASVLTLIIVPVLYAIFFKIKAST
ncbi:Acriflavin resistance protein [hydrothermal vent metagenome]|uniref:Acriflavin resistance protein n=1 Tax=hydrothermal vent metagenome TaxID=652676 RepID=A0A3B0XDZ3_9ZZZZ